MLAASTISRNRPEKHLAQCRNQTNASGEGFETKFLTLASTLCEDTKWQKLVKELEAVDSDYLAQLKSADSRD